MQLVITEKPSVARSISEVIGATEISDGYMEGNGYIVSWCVGHLVELAQPESYGEQWKKWTYESLPVNPEKWQYEVKPDTKAQYDVLCQLMHRKDVTATICATDAGREGELIFRLVYEMAGCQSPSPGCGSPRWRTRRSGRASLTCAPAQSTTHCIGLPSAARKRTGSLGLTPQGCSPSSTTAP